MPEHARIALFRGLRVEQCIAGGIQQSERLVTHVETAALLDDPVPGHAPARGGGTPASGSQEFAVAENRIGLAKSGCGEPPRCASRFLMLVAIKLGLEVSPSAS